MPEMEDPARLFEHLHPSPEDRAPQREMGEPGKELAVVDADRCASCGICAGACPSSTPFRSVARLVTGIDMPQSPIGVLRERLRDALAGRQAERPIVVFGCDHGPDILALRESGVIALNLICAGQLPPSFVEYALRDGAAGVLITGCSEGGCAYRHGPQLAQERLLHLREPHLRPSVPSDRWALAWADGRDRHAVPAALRALRARIDAAQNSVAAVAGACS